ncbi:glycosyl transferase [Rhodococcus hoagii]|nr:glycosyl transferase [Prescottella equi]
MAWQFLLRWAKRLLLVGLVLATLLTVVSFAMALALRAYTPDDTAFMRANPGAIHEWVDLDHISRYPIAAAVVYEDVEFGRRTGAFDVGKFVGTAQSYMGGQHDIVGGSTIHQQLAKNLWLSETRSAWRKGVEAGLSMSMALSLSDRRVIELYMNYVQLGPKLYGVCAASWYYFDSPPWLMTEYQAAQLMAVLPLPSLARRADGGGMYVAGDADLQDWFYRKVYRVAPHGIAAMGGYRKIMDQIGIPDDASDHEHTGAHSCSTMPDQVRTILGGE